MSEQESKHTVAEITASNALSIDQMKQLRKMLDECAQNAVTSAMQNAAEISTMIIDHMEERAAKWSEQPIMKIRIGTRPEIKLEKPACKLLPDLIQLIEAKENVYIQGPAGCGKTTIVEQAAQVLGKTFYHFVFTPDMGVTSVFGRQTTIIGREFVESIVVKAAREGALLFLDEVDNAAPETLVGLNGLGDKSGRLYNPVTGENIKIHEDFRLVAAGNTYGLGASHDYTARQRQDKASLSRFRFLTMDYDTKLERAIVRTFGEDESMFNLLVDARAKLKKLNASEIISTRHIEAAYNMKLNCAGWSDEKIIRVAITQPWPEGLAAQVGL